MINLIWKDILIQKKTFIYAILYGFFAMVAFPASLSASGGYMFSGISIVYLLIIYANAYDEKNRSEVIINSLPVNRDSIVIAKYLSIILYLVIGVVISAVAGLIVTQLGFIENMRIIGIVDILTVFISACLMYSIYYPVYFKFGSLKLKLFNVAMYMLFLFVPNILTSYIQENPDNGLINKITHFFKNTNSLVLQGGLAIIVLLLLFVSMLISIKVYKNKEF